MIKNFRTKLKEGKLAFGASGKAEPRMAKVLAKAGIDFFIIDMMFSPLDWSAAQTATWACDASGIASIVRIQSNPWLSPGDPRIVTDAARAFSIGFDGVIYSTSSAKELEHVMKTAKDWHRVASGVYRTSAEEMVGFMDRVGEETILIPLLECETALRELKEIYAIDGVQVVWLGLTDIARVLGHPHEYEHPDVWRVIDQAVEIANKRGKAVFCNLGYIFTDFASITQRFKRLYDHGVRMVSFPVEFLTYISAKNIRAEVWRLTSETE